MQAWIIILAVLIFAILAGLFIAKKLGKSERGEEIAEQSASDMKEYEKIDSQPFISGRPLDLMFKRKK